MAKVYAAPEKWVPDYSTRDYKAEMAREAAYVERIREQARKNTSGSKNDDLLGEVLQWGRGDGYAQYVVWSVKPLSLVWLQTGDAWAVEAALLRGLRLADVRQMVASSKRFAALFGKGGAK